MIKQISDLSAVTSDELNQDCQFILDDSNTKTRKVSFGILKDKITDGISTGVSKIIAGDNVTIEPSTGIGDVKISCSGGGEGSVLMPDYKNQISIQSGGAAPENCIFIAHNDNNGTFSVFVDGVQVGYGYTYDGNGGMSTSSGLIPKGSIVSYSGNSNIRFFPLKPVQL